MRHSFSFAVTLHRVFDSAPPKSKALFFSGPSQLYPTEKPNGLYVFLKDAESTLTVICDGFARTSARIEQGGVTPVILYPDKFFVAPPGWRLVHGKGEPDRLLYTIDNGFEPRLAEHNMEQGFVRIRSRKGFAGGSLLFESEGQKEIALILEKRSPDIFYMSKLERDYTNGVLRRVYCARTDAGGEFYLAVPGDFSFTEVDYMQA